MISKEERLAAAIEGEIADRPPVALWRHFPVDDQSPQHLAASCLQFQLEYDFDFLKVTPASSYCLKDWGVRDEWTGNPEGTRDYSNRVVLEPGDWNELPLLNPQEGSLADHLQALRLIAEEIEQGTPFVVTIFSPLAQAKNLAGGERLLEHLASWPEKVLAGLEIIRDTTIAFIEAAKAVGISGVFYAVQHASHDLLDWPAYERYGLPHDMQILESADDLWLNILHLHGRALMFELAERLQPSVVNWHDRETAPDIKTGAGRISGAVLGGLQRWETLVLGDPRRVHEQAREAILSLDGGGMILGTGCVVPITAPRVNIKACRSAVDCV
jgi:uroporphyrinogen decarboxylase